MREQYAYVIQGNEVTLLRCWGDTRVVLPETIEGLPVTRLADHIFAKEPSGRLKTDPVRYWSPDKVWEDPDRAGMPEMPVFGKAPEGADALSAQVQEIVLPPRLREIGSYAFYGCRVLRRIIFPDTLELLGSGIFTACGHIDEIRYTGAPRCLREILGEIEGEILVYSEDTARTESRSGSSDGFCLLFPGYYEESIENTPARIIEVKYEGAGYQYRQCFRDGQIDLRQYDRLFYAASVQETPATAVRLAVRRLYAPYALEKNAQQTYLDFLRKQSDVCADYVFSASDRMELLKLLCRLPFFDRELLDSWSDRCVREKDPQAMSLLADLRRRMFPAKKKKYSF